MLNDDQITRQRARLATIVRNASTHRCVFVVWDGLEMTYKDGALYRVTPNASPFRRAHISSALLRVEELVNMTDDDIWARVMGES